MGVITTDVWEPDPNDPSGITVTTIPDTRAYGLAVMVSTAERGTTDWTKFWDGVLVIDTDTRVLYFVINGALQQVA